MNSLLFLMLLASQHVLCQVVGFDAREATIETVHQELYSGLTSCRGVVSGFLSRIQAFNGAINAIIALNSNALTTADAMDHALSAGNATGRLFCIPVLLKDNYDTADLNTTGGNLGLAGSQPSVDAPAVTALRQAGAIILGKTNLHELALEGLSVSSAGGQTINPYDSTRTPGGSSGGSGAAVAASFAVFATGTDTVNSLRSPASANSLFSIRPTRGLITRNGIIPISYTQDTIGPIARTTKDVAVALTVMASTGYDPNDNATASVPQSSRGKDYSASITSGSLRGLRIGILDTFFNRTASNETAPVNAALDTIISKLQSAGATIIPINESIYNAPSLIATLDVQRFEYRESIDAYFQRPTLKGNHPQTLRQLYSSNNKDYLVIPSQYEYVATALTSSTSNATYPTIQRAIQNLTLALHSTFSSNNLSLLLYPEQRNLVVKLGSPSQSGRNGILAALTGFPVVTVPAGFSAASQEAPIGVPIGMEMMARPWSEEDLLRIAYRVEMLTHVRRIPFAARGFVETTGEFESVPSVVPNSGDISNTYPVGVR